MMRLVSVVLVAAAVAGLAAADEKLCLRTFNSCEAACPTLARSEFATHRSAPYDTRLRLCVKTCAKESALCQDQEEVAADSATIGSGNNPWSSFNDALGRPTLPFGFYQYSIADARNFHLPEEESVHGMSLSAPYVSTAAPTEQWFEDMQAFLDRCREFRTKRETITNLQENATHRDIVRTRPSLRSSSRTLNSFATAKGQKFCCSASKTNGMKREKRASSTPSFATSLRLIWKRLTP